MTRTLFRLMLPFVVVSGVTCMPHSACGGTAIIDFEGVAGSLIAFSADSTMGWAFTARGDILVTELGFIDWGIGLSMRHSIGIWDSQGKLLTTTELGGTAPFGRIISPGAEVPPWPRLHEGDYLYEPIDPLLLRAGETYTIGATVPITSPYVPDVVGWISRFDGYPIFVDPDSLAVDPSIEIRDSGLVWRGGAGPNFIFGPGELHLPDESVANSTLVGVNFKFVAVPEPNTAILVCITILVWLMFGSRRNEYRQG